MSTTSNLEVALSYSLSASSLLFKVRTESFMQRGANLQYLSAFPGEAEFLYPPLTFCRPTGRKAEVKVNLEQVSCRSPGSPGVLTKFRESSDVITMLRSRRSSSNVKETKPDRIVAITIYEIEPIFAS